MVGTTNTAAAARYAVTDSARLLPRPDNRHYTLVSLCPGQLGQLVTGIQAHLYPRVPAGLDQLLEADILAFAGDANVIELPRPGTQSLLDRVQAKQNLHTAKFRLWCIPVVCGTCFLYP